MERVKSLVREAWLEVRNACGIVFLAMVLFFLFITVGGFCLAFFMTD